MGVQTTRALARGPTSYLVSTSAISTVAAVWRAPSSILTSWPVTAAWQRVGESDQSTEKGEGDDLCTAEGMIWLSD